MPAHSVRPYAVTFAGGLGLAVAWTLWQRGAAMPDMAMLLATLSMVDWWGALALPWLGLGVEALIVGWRSSALRRVLVDPSPSARTDVTFQLFTLSGGFESLVRFSSLGLIAWADRQVGTGLRLLPLEDWSLWASFPAMWIAASFIGYWEHRIKHSRWLWSLHKVHHGAAEFTLLNSFRGHPVEMVLGAIANTLPLAMIGFSLEHIAVFNAVTLAWPLFLHSHWTRTAWLERFGVCTPAGHRMHHGIAEEHHDRNFGELTNLWDKLFGTYVAPGPGVDQVEIGLVAPSGRRNTQNPLREIALQTVEWLQVLRAEARKMMRQRRTALSGPLRP